MEGYTPAYTVINEARATKTVVTSEEWNALFNLLATQGNSTATALYNFITLIEGSTGAADVGGTPITGVTGTTVQTIMVGLKALIDACYTQAATDALLATKESVTDANALVKTIAFNAADGKFIFTTQGGAQTIIDTALEKVATNFTYNATTQALDLTLADGSTTSVPLSAFITETEFLDSSTIDFTLNNHVVTATIKDGSITDTMLSSTLAAAFLSYKNAAETAATNAAASEANALTYKNAAAGSATAAAGSATDADNARIAAQTSQTNADNARIAAQTAQTNAETSETNAETAAVNAKTAETNAVAAKNAAELALTHAPYIDDTTGNWFIWNATTSAYVDSGTYATGDTGNGISSVALNPDYTLTINFTDSTSTTTTSIRGDTGAKGDTGDTGATGNGVASIVLVSGTHSAGTTDTYRITFTDSTTFDFTVYNGADGEGSGDMLKATYDTNNSGVVDNAEKVNGLTVLTAVPSGAVFTDTIYTHPANHPPSIITQDASNRFVTDTEKAEWNGKANPPTAVTATLSTTWEGSGPYTQSVTVSGVTSTNNITVSLASTADEAQRNAARDALLSATAQATNSITVTADGDKPIVALPIQVLILGG